MTAPGPVHPLLNHRDWLFDQLITQHKTAKTIGGEIGVSDNTVIRAARYHAIDIRKYRRLARDRATARQRRDSKGRRQAYGYWPGHM